MTIVGTTPQLQSDIDVKSSGATKPNRRLFWAMVRGGAYTSAKRSFVRDVFVFGWANIISLFLNGLLSFLLPRFLAVDDFGYYRLFLLYANFAGVAHLGMLEGILVRWSEKPEERIDPEISNIFLFLSIQHILLLVPLCIPLIWISHGRWLWFGSALAIYILICNVSTLGQIALQARRRFSALSIATVLSSIALFGLVLAWEFLSHLNARTAIALYIFATLVAAAAIWKMVFKGHAERAQSDSKLIRLGWDNIRIGWRLLLANFLVAFTPSLDRFFVSGVFSIREFATYAFAGNALAIVYTITISTAQVVYPYLSGATSPDSRKRAYPHGRSLIIALWAVSQVLYFPTAFLVRLILPAYVGSLPIMRLLIISSGLVAIINVLHVNYFRVSLALNRFLLGSLGGLFAVSAIIAAVRHKNNLLLVAAATITGVLIWWVTNEVLLAQEMDTSRLNWVMTFIIWLLGSALFWESSSVKRLWMGGLIYSISCALLLFIGLRDSLGPLFAQTFRLESPVAPEP